MKWPALALIIGAVALLVGVPLTLRPGAESPAGDALKLIIITPHTEPIRAEFGWAFDQWHRRRFGPSVTIWWSTPGGTSEIVRMLQAQYQSALRDGRAPGGSADLVFGGGSYEHSQLKRGIEVLTKSERRFEPISTPVDFDAVWLSAIYGENRIGDGRLYDPDRFWFGTALSGFGIVYNRDVLRRLRIPQPRTWADLCHPRLRGWVALVNPAQSGSITTAFQAILEQRGWAAGWRILRRAAANARYFSASAPKAPIDVGLADAAAGVCIDFYGRYQAQAVSTGGQERVGYVDPAGETVIDADPISMLRGAPHPELARRFIEFCLSLEAQSLWQFPAATSAADGLGPRRFELRRMPILRAMYPDYLPRMVDHVNPYAIASPAANPNPDVRSFIAPMFAALGMDNHQRLRAAWDAIVSHPAYPSNGTVVTGQDVSDPVLRQMLDLFDAMPEAPGPDGALLPLDSDANLAAVRSGWRTAALWPGQGDGKEITKLRFTSFFADNYERIVELGAAHADREQ